MSIESLLIANRLLTDEATEILVRAIKEGRGSVTKEEEVRLEAIRIEREANCARIGTNTYWYSGQPYKTKTRTSTKEQCTAATIGGDRCSKSASKDGLCVTHDKMRRIEEERKAAEIPAPYVPSERPNLDFPKVSMRLDIDDVTPVIDVVEIESVPAVKEHFINDTITKRASAMLRDAYSWQRLQRSRRWEGMRRSR